VNKAAPQRSTTNAWIQLGQFLRGSLPVLERVSRDERPLVPFKLGALQGYLVNHPDIVEQALESEEWPPLARGRMDAIKHWYEGGLATKTGPVHHRHRDRMWIPNLADPRILERGIEEATRWPDHWRDGGTIEAYEDLRRLAYGIGWRALTNESLHDQRPLVYEALAAGDAWLGRLVHPLGTLRWRLPTPESRRGHRLRRELDTAIDTLAAARRNGFDGEDLLRDWVRSNDELGSTDADLRGSLKAFFGAENLHTHLAWTFYLLAQNPEVEAKLHEELDTVLDGRPPTPDDLEALEYTRHVVTESLRIYPSVPAFFRGIRGDGLRLGDETVPAGSLLGFSPWTIQRDARWWPDPLRFDPDRWGAGRERPPRFAYFPFAAGPYRCPGTAKSVKEGPLVLATLAQRWRMRIPAGAPAPVPTATWALRPRDGMPLITERR
jgi:cytochrome P450